MISLGGSQVPSLPIICGTSFFVLSCYAFSQLVSTDATAFDCVRVMSTLAFIAYPAYLLIFMTVLGANAPRKETAGKEVAEVGVESLVEHKKQLNGAPCKQFAQQSCMRASLSVGPEAAPSSDRTRSCDFTDYFLRTFFCFGVATTKEPEDGDLVASAEVLLKSSFRPSTIDGKDWWSHACPRMVKDLEEATLLTRLQSCDLVCHPTLSASSSFKPWLPGMSFPLYSRLGASNPSSSYVALWLNAGQISLLAVSEVVDRQAVDWLLSVDEPFRKLKLVLQPVRSAIPLPVKRIRDADNIANFFGSDASIYRSRSPEGLDLVVIQVDLFSVWSVKLALKTVGFKVGNVIDIIIVDWPGRAVLSSFRVSVTPSVANSIK